MLFHLTVESGQMDLCHSEVCSSRSKAVCHLCKDSNPTTLAHLFILYHHRKLVTSLCPEDTDDRRHCCKMVFSRSAQLSIELLTPRTLINSQSINTQFKEHSICHPSPILLNVSSGVSHIKSILDRREDSLNLKTQSTNPGDP